MTETRVSSAPTGVDRAFLDEFIPRWEAAWNSHNPDRLLELMTEDVVYDDSGWPRTMRGHGDVREFLAFTWRALPDLEFHAVEGPFIAPDEPKAAFYWRGTGTLTGPIDPPGFAPTGATCEFEGFDQHEYRDGKVSRLRIVFDMMDLSRQLGLFPQQGSRAEKAAAAAQRLGVQIKQRLGR
jgi:steroid delta-isomerase-like uncharacterized protein